MNTLEQLTANCSAENLMKLSDLYKSYELAKLGREIQDEQIKGIYNQVLAEHEFFSSQDFGRMGLKKGERITDESNDFCMSEDDFRRFQELCAPRLVEDGITDENGYYVTKWTDIEVDARRELIDFIIDNIIPMPLRKDFANNQLSYTMGEKLLAITRPLVAA